MRRPAVLIPLIAVVLAGCGGDQPVSPGASASPASTPGSRSPASSSPAVAVNPLIPELAPDGSMRLLQRTGSVSGVVPASRPLQLFAPYGGDFLVGIEHDQAVSALASLEPGGRVDTLHIVNDPATFGGATAAADAHAFAWVEGTPQSGLCSNGVASGTVFAQPQSGLPQTVVHLPASGGGTWSLGGFAGNRIWLTLASGCPSNPGYITQAYAVDAGGGNLIPLQALLGNGCTLVSMALDGSMLCTTKPGGSQGTWRLVTASGAHHDFTEDSLGTPCHGFGPLHDFEGFALSPDGRYISVDAGCVGGSRFDHLYIITAATGAVTSTVPPTYLAADSFLPDDSLLCNNLAVPSQATAYVVNPRGVARVLGAGQATWSGGGVVW